MTLAPVQWAIALLGAILVGVAKTGMTGLGILSVALFANLFPSAKQASGIVLPLLIIGDLVAVFTYRRHTQWRYLWRLFPWTAAGVVLGRIALGQISDRQAKVLIGVIILSLIVLTLWRRRAAAKVAAVTGEADPAPPGPAFAPFVGVLAGFTTLVANAAGPLMAIYLLAMRLPKMEYVGTGAVFFLLLNLFKVPFMANLGLINGDSLRFNLLLAPAVLAGAWLGRWMLTRINQKLFEHLVLILSALAALKLLS